MNLRVISTITIVSILSIYTAFSQCACGGGAAVGGLTPLGGTTNVGLVKKSNLRISAFYSYTSGETYFERDIKAGMGNIESFNTHYLSLIAGYGLTKKLTLEGEIGFFPGKIQN